MVILSISKCRGESLLCDGQMQELTRNYRAENEVDFKEFIADLRNIKNRWKPDFKSYSPTDVGQQMLD